MLITVQWWSYGIETFLTLLVLCKGRLCGTYMFSLLLAWTCLKTVELHLIWDATTIMSNGIWVSRVVRMIIICERINPPMKLNNVTSRWPPTITLLTHWGRDKMDAISQLTFSSTFSWMKMFELRLRIHRKLFLRVQLAIIFQHRFKSWYGAVQATSHYMNEWWLDYRRIYASFGLNEV